MVVEVSGDDLLQPSSLFRDWLMHPPTQLLFDRLQLRPHTVGSGLPLDLELAPPRLAADEDEAQEAEGLRFAKSAPFAACRRIAPELDQPGLLRVERQRVFSQSLSHLVQEAPGVRLVLETNDQVVSVAHDDHVAGGLAPSPAFGPEIEDVVQVDVGKQR